MLQRGESVSCSCGAPGAEGHDGGIRRVAVIGAGKMGSWLAKEIAEDYEVAVFDRDSSKSAGVEGAGALASLEELGEFKPNLVVNAVSLSNTVSAFEEIVGHIPAGCIISDVASIKEDIADYYKECGFRFASVHPMFGPTFANVEALSQENAIIIKESDAEGAAFFRKLFCRLGLNIFEYSFSTHDRMMAYSLGLPFISTLVFASCMKEDAVPGTTFAKHKRIAQGLLSEDDHLLAEIIFNPWALRELEQVTSRLEFMKHIIKNRDMEEAARFFGKLRENMR